MVSAQGCRCGKEADLRFHRQFALITLLAAAAASGSACPKRSSPMPGGKIVFAELPELDEVIRVVNANTAPVQRLEARGATIRVSAMSTALWADLALERPRRVRMRAGT